MQDPLISVIVPVYNTKEYLSRCVASICGQTYGNLEILLVDDGSTDGAGKLCDELAAGDPRIRVLHKANGGSSSARNLGLDHARGAYIGFVDSDDYIDADMYRLLYEAVVQYGVRVAQVGRDETDEQGNRLPDICVPPADTQRISGRDFLRELLMHRGDCSFCTKLFDRRLLETRRFPQGALNEDFHFLVRMLPEIGDILSLPPQAYHVFYRMGSNSRKADKEDFSRVYEDSVANADMVAGLVDAGDRELVKTARRFGIFQRLEYLLHIPVSRMTRDNGFYRQVVRDLRRSFLPGLCNPYLTAKNKFYMTLFVIAPRGVRVLHRRIRGL
ncbi:MAG: glycosyltransferase [Muribaculum sp.]|nr:glycosyltransferase [Muribaculum sp.]